MEDDDDALILTFYNQSILTHSYSLSSSLSSSAFLGFSREELFSLRSSFLDLKCGLLGIASSDLGSQFDYFPLGFSAVCVTLVEFLFEVSD